MLTDIFISLDQPEGISRGETQFVQNFKGKGKETKPRNSEGFQPQEGSYIGPPLYIFFLKEPNLPILINAVSTKCLNDISQGSSSNQAANLHSHLLSYTKSGNSGVDIYV